MLEDVLIYIHATLARTFGRWCMNWSGPGVSKLLTCCLTFVALLFLPSVTKAEDREMAAVFARHGVEGTMVISSLDGRTVYVHNADRARRRYPVASTFKVLNTLIAVQEGAVSGKEEVIRWDGHRYDIPDWNRDQTLESAFRVSCVWYFQELARRVGAAKYRDYVTACSFGELDEPFDGTAFWLDGSLRASAEEQVAFLRKVRLRSLPFDRSAYDTLDEIMVVENNSRYVIRAKSGWAARSVPGTGWYVGWVESGKKCWLFALNIDVHGERELPLRKVIAMEALRAGGIIE